MQPKGNRTGAEGPEELIGKPVLDVVHPDYREMVIQRVRKIIEEGESVSRAEEKFLRLDGATVDVDVAATPIVYRGKPSVLVVALDVTERKRLEEQFLQAQKMEGVGQLAGGVAHDFNNLLTIITGNVQLALMNLSDQEEARGYLEESQRAGERAADLTKQLLVFSRRHLIEPQTLDLNSLITNMERMLRRLIREDIQMELALAPDLWPVRADPGQIEQVLVNLVVNARDAMPASGKLTIETANVTLEPSYTRLHHDASAGEHVRVAVSDTGIGMDERVKSHIFEPFFTTKTPGQGTGLGLTTCYGIVRQAGGHIAVYSEPGRGATFHIYLPRVEQGDTALAQEAPASDLLKGTETVLLAEDEESVRESVASMLQQLGYRVLKAANGREALHIAQERADEEIHLLLTDAVMPQMGGKELADRMGHLRPDTKVLFMSGHADSIIAHQGVLGSGIAFLRKPFTLPALALKVREVLEGQG